MQPLHEQLFWDGSENRWAVKEGKWKLVFDRKAKLELYDLEKDISESSELASVNPEKVSELEAKYKTWKAEMKSPMGKLKNKANNKKKQE